MQARSARHAHELNGEGFWRSVYPPSIGGIRQLRGRNGVRCILLNRIEAGLCHRQQHHCAGGCAVTATMQRLHQFFGRIRICLCVHSVHAVVHAVVVHRAVVHCAVVDHLTSAGRIPIQMTGKHAGLRHALDRQRKQHQPHEEGSNYFCHNRQHTILVKTGQARESCNPGEDLTQGFQSLQLLDQQHAHHFVL
jgi:hypothetical protein